MNDVVWLVHPPRAEADALAAALGLPPAIARVLVNRKILTEEAARAFLYGELDKLHDPYLMKGMDRGRRPDRRGHRRRREDPHLRRLRRRRRPVDGHAEQGPDDARGQGRVFHPGAPDRRLRHQGRARPHPGRAGRDARHQRRLRHQVRRVRRPGPGAGRRRHHHRPSPAGR